MRIRRGFVVLAAVLLHGPLASAQSLGGHGGHGGGHAPPAGGSAPALADIPVARGVWPRLDIGAVFCQSQAGLIAHANLADANPDQPRFPSGCRPVVRMEPVTIVSRVPPGSTQVRLTRDGEVGWTDAWLPVNGPRDQGRSAPPGGLGRPPPG